MPSVQIKDVPEGTHAVLRQRAAAAHQSLQEYLLWQLELARVGPRELAIARAIVDAINDDGYLVEPLEDCDDVQNVYANVDVSDEIMEAVG